MLFSATLNTSVIYSSVASLICQEGQSERNFPIFAFSSRFFLFFPIFPDFFPIFPDFSPDFWQIFAARSGTLPPLPPQWLRHWLTMNQLHFDTKALKSYFIGGFILYTYTALPELCLFSITKKLCLFSITTRI